MSSNRGISFIDDPIVPMKKRDPSDRGKVERAMAHAMAKQQDAWAGLANPGAFPDLIGSDYINRVTQTEPSTRSYRLRRSRDVEDVVQHIEKLYAETGTSPAFLASLDPEDLQFLSDGVGLQVLGPLEGIMARQLEARNQNKRLARLANHYYNEELARRELLEGTVQARALRTQYGLPIADPAEDQLDEFEGLEFRVEDWERAVREAHQIDEFAVDDGGIDDFFMFGMGAKFDREAELQAFADVVENDSWVGKQVWDALALRAGTLAGGIFDFLFRAGGAIGATAAAVESGFGSIVGDPDAGWDQAGQRLSQAKTWITQGAEGFVTKSKPGPVLRKGRYGQDWNDPEIRKEVEKVKDKIKNGVLPQEALAEVQANSPEVWEHYVRTYGDTQMAIQGFYMDFDLGTLDIDVEDQLEELARFHIDSKEQLHDRLEEQNFIGIAPGMEWIMSYGRWVDSIGANVLQGLGLGEGEEKAMIRELQLGSFVEEQAVAMEMANHTPSGVLGLDGTFVGLMVDMGLGIVFDPTTWAIGPVGKGIGLTSKSMVQTAVKGPAIRLMVRDFIKHVPDVLRSGISKAALLSPFAEVGLADEALAAAGLADQILPQGNFLRGTFGRTSHVADLDFVWKILDDAQIEQLDNLNPQTVEQIGNSLKNKGFDNPIVVELDEATGTIAVTDGLKRLAAARATGATKVPFSIKIKRAKAADAVPAALKPDDPIFTTEHQLAPADVYQTTFPGEVDGLRRELLDTDAPGFAPVSGANGPAVSVRDFLEDVGSGIREPLILQIDNAGVVKMKNGNHRLAAAMELDLDSVPVRFERFDGLFPASATVSAPNIHQILGITPPKATAGISVEALGGRMPGNLDPHKVWQNNTWTINPTALFDLETLGTVGNRELTEALFQKALLSGASLTASNGAWLSAGLGLLARELFTTGAGQKLARLFKPVTNSYQLLVHGPTGAKNMYRLVEFLGATNPEWTNYWLQRIMQNQKANGARSLAKMSAEKRLSSLQRLDADLAARQLDRSPWEPQMVAAYGDEGLRTAKNLDEARAALRRLMSDARREMDFKIEQLAPATQSWQELFDEMLTEYVHKFQHESWGDALVDPDGTVNWHLARRSHPDYGPVPIKRGVLEETQVAQRRAIQDSGIAYDPSLNVTLPPDEAMKMLGDAPDDFITLPLTPMELAGLSTSSGSRYTRGVQTALGAHARSLVVRLDGIWTASMLLVPKIFATLSLDEIHSLLHANLPEFGKRYLRLRADRLQARLNSGARLMDMKTAEGLGATKLSQRAQERLRAVNDLPDQYRRLGEQVMEDMSREVVQIAPGEIGYVRAAQEFAQRHLQNPAFRAYLRGRSSFKEWVLSPDGQEWFYSQRVQTTIDNKAVYRPFESIDEAYQLFDTVWKKRFVETARRSGVEDRLADWEEAWRRAAARYDKDPSSGRMYTLDEWTLPYMGIIDGLQTAYPGSHPIWSSISRGFEKGAADPARTRQGLAAETMRHVETTRLTALFEDQGMRILSDWELIDLMKTRGMDVEFMNAMNSPALDSALFKEGIVTQGYISRLAESRAMEFADTMTYSGEVGSQAGRRGRAIWRFGQAYGDMFGRWGRMLGSRMILRPWLGRGRLGQALQRAVDLSPVNLKTAGALSRFSARDLNITGGFVGESETELDFSPMTFLPTQSGGFHTLFPGFGPIPITATDLAVSWFGPDPAEDPVGYSEMLDRISTIMPSMAYHGRDWYTRFTGAGNVGFLLNTTASWARGILHNPNFQGWRFTGDVRSELLHSRQVNVVFSDPDFIEDILEAGRALGPSLSTGSPELVEEMILEGIYRADLASASSNLFTTVGSWAIPVKGALDSNMDQLYRPWITSARRNMDFFDIDLPNDDALQADQQLLLRTGDDIRRQFFNLEPWQRQLILATSPELAANMVQVWEWAPHAPKDLPGREIPYRTTGSSPDDPSLHAALERHSVYVNRGWVLPRDSYLKPYDIIGTHLEARNDISEYAYNVVATEMNDIRWEALVSDRTKTVLTTLLDNPRLQDLGVTTARELWEMWSTQRERVREELAESLGLSLEDEDTLKRINEFIKIPETEEAWSTQWKGDDLDIDPAWSARALESPVFINEQAADIFSRLGIDAESGMTGKELIAEIVEYRSQYMGTWNAIKLQYDGWVQKRGLPFATGMAALQEVTANPNLSQEYRQEMADFMDWADRQVQIAESRHPTRAIQDEAVDRFNRLRTAGRDAPVNWDKVWHYAFQQQFGPLNWEPPTPLSPFKENGDMRGEAWQPYIRDVVDGDTLLVSTKKGPTLLGGPYPMMGTTGPTRYHTVRLLGVMAPEYGMEGGKESTERLQDALEQARRDGQKIYLVRDPDYAGSNTDPFGRELAWLWIGDTPYFFADELRRTE